MRNTEITKEAINKAAIQNLQLLSAISRLELTSEGGPALLDFGRLYNLLKIAAESCEFDMNDVIRCAVNLRNNAARNVGKY